MARRGVARESEAGSFSGLSGHAGIMDWLETILSALQGDTAIVSGFPNCQMLSKDVNYCQMP
jgi:hypothetical protein